MPVEMLTYADLASRVKISPEAARALAKRLRLQRTKGNVGKALVSVDLAENPFVRVGANTLALARWLSLDANGSGEISKCVFWELWR